jgi:hypothetical protein
MAGMYGSASFSVFLAGGLNLLAAKVKGVRHGTEIPTENTLGLGETAENHTPIGMERAVLAQEQAIFSDVTNGIHLALRAPSSTPRVVTWAYRGNTIGSGFTGMLGALVASYEVLVSLAGLHKANATYRVSGALEEGVILQPHQQQTVDWTNTSVDNGASSAAGGVGFLEVSQLAGLTGFVGVIEHSTDNSAWSTLISFANVTAAPAAQRVEVAGTVNRYLRFRGDVTGTGTVTVFAGFARG